MELEDAIHTAILTLKVCTISFEKCEFEQCLYFGGPPCYEQNRIAERTATVCTVSFEKCEFEQCLYFGGPPCYEQNRIAERTATPLQLSDIINNLITSSRFL